MSKASVRTGMGSRTSETVGERSGLRGASHPRTANTPIARRHMSASGPDREPGPLALGRVEIWEEMDWVSRECRLTPAEKAVLAMARLEAYTHHEIGEELGMAEARVGATLVSALRKARAHFERSASPRALFWEEIRQKSRSIYRGRRRSRTVR